ncbi:MAG TPA: hypothetical protein VKU01_03100 [Bryobacteraceae bacterium]|nr:hypothetical protein [Bryobacteraceae bacterium]
MARFNLQISLSAGSARGAGSAVCLHKSCTVKSPTKTCSFVKRMIVIPRFRSNHTSLRRSFPGIAIRSVDLHDEVVFGQKKIDDAIVWFVESLLEPIGKIEQSETAAELVLGWSSLLLQTAPR